MKRSFLFFFLFLCGCAANTPHFSATGTAEGCKPKYLTDDNDNTYWTCNEEVTKPVILLKYNKPFAIDEVIVKECETEQEPSCVEAFLLEGCAAGAWMQLGYAVREDGNPSQMSFPGIKVTQLRLTIVLKPGARSPKIAAFEVLCSPEGAAEAEKYDITK